jgi:hypothetical protein
MHNVWTAPLETLAIITQHCALAGVLHMHNVWTAPLETLAIIALLLSITEGIFGLPALSILILGLPLQCEFYLSHNSAGLERS